MFQISDAFGRAGSNPVLDAIFLVFWLSILAIGTLVERDAWANYSFLRKIPKFQGEQTTAKAVKSRLEALDIDETGEPIAGRLWD